MLIKYWILFFIFNIFVESLCRIEFLFLIQRASQNLKDLFRSLQGMYNTLSFVFLLSNVIILFVCSCTQYINPLQGIAIVTSIYLLKVDTPSPKQLLVANKFIAFQIILKRFENTILVSRRKSSGRSFSQPKTVRILYQAQIFTCCRYTL